MNKKDDLANDQERKNPKPHEENLLSGKISKSKSRLSEDRSQKKKLILIALLVLLFFALLIVVIYRMPDLHRQENEGETVGKLQIADVETVLPVEPGEANFYYPFSDQFVYFSRDKIELLNSSGKILYDESLDYNRPVAVYNAEYFVAGDRDSNQVIILNHKSKRFTLPLDGTFAGAYFGGNTYLAVIEERVDKPGFVHIVSLETGKIILTIQFFESGYPLAVSFDNDLEFFDILLANTASSDLRSIINRYDLSGKQIGQLIPQGHPSLYVTLTHDRNDNIILGGNSGLLAIDFAGEKPLADFDAGKIYRLINASDVTALISNRVEGDILMIDWDAANQQFVSHETNLPTQIDQVTFNQNILALSKNNQIMLYNLDNEKVLLDQIIDSNIIRIGLLENNLIIISESGIKKLNF